LVDKEECTKVMGRLLEDVTDILGKTHRLTSPLSLDSEIRELEMHLKGFKMTCLEGATSVRFDEVMKDFETLKEFQKRCEPSGVFAKTERIGVLLADVITVAVSDKMKGP